jgi:hypothetical protein
MTLVVGLDPSLTGTGIAWADGRCMKIGRTGLTVVRDKKTGAPIPLRERGEGLMRLVLEIGNRILLGPDAGQVAVDSGLGQLSGTALRSQPDLVMIEELPPSAAHADSERDYLWWSLVNLLERQGVRCVPVPVTVAKKYATGSGSCAKEAMVAATARRLSHFQTRDDKDMSDAAWMCAVGMDLVGEPLVTADPAKHWTKDGRKTMQAVMAAAGFTGT